MPTRPLKAGSIARPFWLVQIALMACTAGGSTAWSESRERDAHVHGHGRLNVAVEGAQVDIELMVPGADIVGFEHRPRTAAQKASARKAAATLRSGDKMFVFPTGAKCKLMAAKVASPLIAHAHDHHGHHKAHKKHGKEEHAEFRAEYRFRCDNPGRLTHIDVEIFKHFPGSRELSVQALSPRGQSAQELTPGSARLTL